MNRHVVDLSFLSQARACALQGFMTWQQEPPMTVPLSPNEVLLAAWRDALGFVYQRLAADPHALQAGGTQDNLHAVFESAWRRAGGGSAPAFVARGAAVLRAVAEINPFADPDLTDRRIVAVEPTLSAPAPWPEARVRLTPLLLLSTEAEAIVLDLLPASHLADDWLRQATAALYAWTIRHAPSVPDTLRERPTRVLAIDPTGLTLAPSSGGLFAEEDLTVDPDAVGGVLLALSDWFEGLVGGLMPATPEPALCARCAWAAECPEAALPFVSLTGSIRAHK